MKKEKSLVSTATTTTSGMSRGTKIALAIVGLVCFVALTKIADAVGGWKWGAFIAGAIAFVVGLTHNNKNFQKIGFWLAVVGLTLILAGWAATLATVLAVLALIVLILYILYLITMSED